MNERLQRRLLKVANDAYFDLRFLLAMIPDELRDACQLQAERLALLDATLSKLERVAP